MTPYQAPTYTYPTHTAQMMPRAPKSNFAGQIAPAIGKTLGGLAGSGLKALQRSQATAREKAQQKGTAKREVSRNPTPRPRMPVHARVSLTKTTRVPFNRKSPVLSKPQIQTKQTLILRSTNVKAAAQVKPSMTQPAISPTVTPSSARKPEKTLHVDIKRRITMEKPPTSKTIQKPTTKPITAIKDRAPVRTVPTMKPTVRPTPRIEVKRTFNVEQKQSIPSAGNKPVRSALVPSILSRTQTTPASAPGKSVHVDIERRMNVLKRNSTVTSKLSTAVSKQIQTTTSVARSASASVIPRSQQESGLHRGSVEVDKRASNLMLAGGSHANGMSEATHTRVSNKEIGSRGRTVSRTPISQHSETFGITRSSGLQKPGSSTASLAGSTASNSRLTTIQGSQSRGQSVSQLWEQNSGVVNGSLSDLKEPLQMGMKKTARPERQHATTSVVSSGILMESAPRSRLSVQNVGGVQIRIQEETVVTGA